MKKPELLAPVGTKESLRAAIEAGCDAVYLGGYSFGARNFAGNFSNEELIEAINMCHLYGVKVYVTTNTLVYDEEVSLFLNYIDFLYKNNVDAIIIQDLGMMDLIRKTYPDLEIHASTQMHIHNIDGVKVAENLGLKRVVLARETSIEDIKEIKKNTNIELEVFVHGALCVSYSGQCYMSSMTGNRSGNRGTCAQCCRQKYDFYVDSKKINKEDYLLSMQDLNTINNISELIEGGIDSFKIEGRMKRPEYVYLVVSLYRKAIDNYFLNNKEIITQDDVIELKKIFNRKFTSGFIFNSKDIINPYRPNHLGIEIGNVINYKNKIATIKLTDTVNQNDGIRIIGENDYGCILNKIEKNNKLVNQAVKGDIICIQVKEDVQINSKVLKTTDYVQITTINEKLTHNMRKVLVDAAIELKIDNKIKLTLTDRINTVTVEDFIVSSSKNAPVSEDKVKEQISKLGNTVYCLNNFTCNKDENIFVSLKHLNEIRRIATDLLNEKRLYKHQYNKQEYSIKVPNFDHQKNINIEVKSIEQYNKVKDKNFKYIYYHDLIDQKTIYKYNRVIKKYNNYENVLIGELGGLNIKTNIFTDFSLNVTNSYSVAFLHALGVKQVTLSIELSKEQIESLVLNYQTRYKSNPNLELIVYNTPEVMITKYNLFKYHNIDSKIGYLKDTYGNKFPVTNHDEFQIIYDSKLKIMDDIDYYNNLGINNFRYIVLEHQELNKINFKI